MFIFATRKEDKDMKVLTDRTYVTKTNNWYAPLSEFWEQHKSIIDARFMNQSSSSGDWEGFIVQRVGKHRAHCIAFWQENNYPNKGFTFHTAECPFLLGNPDREGFIEDAISCWNQFEIQ